MMYYVYSISAKTEKITSKAPFDRKARAVEHLQQLAAVAEAIGQDFVFYDGINQLLINEPDGDKSIFAIGTKRDMATFSFKYAGLPPKENDFIR